MIINGQNYRIPEITFGVAYKFKQDKGIDLKEALVGVSRLDELSIAAFFSLAVENDLNTAVDLLGQYLSSGGDFVDIVQEIDKAIEESGFFQAWLRTMTKVQKMNKSKPGKKV